nr:LytR C-terminal domain-containing protein [Nocardioides panaciterrulae]
MLSVIAVAMAGIAFFATRAPDAGERDITTVAGAEQHPAPAKTDGPGTKKSQDGKDASKADAHKSRDHKKKPAVQRGKVYVEVYNNSGITGLAGQVAGRATNAGWNVVGSDNWYGSVPASTVYYPQRLEKAAKLLALDLGIHRTKPAVDPMRLDRLTVILTGALG